MLPHHWFDVGLRLIGIVVILYGLAYLVDSLLLRLGYYLTPDFFVGYYFIFGLAYLFVGLYLFLGSRQLVRLVYPEVDEEYTGEDEEGEDLAEPDERR
jgi:hypothetical protein